MTSMCAHGLFQAHLDQYSPSRIAEVVSSSGLLVPKVEVKKEAPDIASIETQPAVSRLQEPILPSDLYSKTCRLKLGPVVACVQGAGGDSGDDGTPSR